MKSKKGSHVGVIASFMIFVIFILAIIFVLEPAFRSEQGKMSLTEYLKGKSIELISEDLVTVLADPNGTGCRLIKGADIEIPSGPSYGTLVKDSDEILDSAYEGNQNQIIFEDKGENLVWAYIAQVNFIDTSYSEITCGNAIVKSVRVNKQVFEENILKEFSDYDSLKSNFDVSENANFAIGFRFINGTEFITGEKNVTGNVFSEEFPIEYMDDEGEFLNGELIIRTW